MRLCDQIFSSPSQLLYCDINDCIELSFNWENVVEKMLIEAGEMLEQKDCVGLETMNDYDYTTSSFAAVVTDWSKEGGRLLILKLVN